MAELGAAVGKPADLPNARAQWAAVFRQQLMNNRWRHHCNVLLGGAESESPQLFTVAHRHCRIISLLLRYLVPLLSGCDEPVHSREPVSTAVLIQ
jgi:hypothetical protein